MFVVPRLRKRLKNQKVSILCNNCTAGFILHDLGLRFDTPTINLYFRGLDFFDFAEHLEYYISAPLCQIENPRYNPDDPDYPVAVLLGGSKYKDIELHFLHYKTFEEAKEKWETRKKRIHWDSLYLIWTFMGMEAHESVCERAEQLPIKNKVFFVNHPVDSEKFPSFFHIKGFEEQVGLGQIGVFMNLKGNRYYDQFDYVDWINKGNRYE